MVVSYRPPNLDSKGGRFKEEGERKHHSRAYPLRRIRVCVKDSGGDPSKELSL